jgi:hypothetical protein
MMQVIPSQTTAIHSRCMARKPRARRARESERLVLLLFAAAHVPARCVSSALWQQNIKPLTQALLTSRPCLMASAGSRSDVMD